MVKGESSGDSLTSLTLTRCVNLNLCEALDGIFKKQRHYFANKGHINKAMVFPVLMYGCESWTIKKAEH